MGTFSLIGHGRLSPGNRDNRHSISWKRETIHYPSHRPRDQLFQLQDRGDRSNNLFLLIAQEEVSQTSRREGQGDQSPDLIPATDAGQHKTKFLGNFKINLHMAL